MGGAAVEGHLGRTGGTQIAAGIGNRRLVDRRQRTLAVAQPSCMALRMSPLSASISQANRPPSWFASTYCPLALTERSLSKVMRSPLLALKT